MKKKFLKCLLITLASLALFSNEYNLNKTFDVDSKIYKNLCTLFIAQKKALPSSTGPWSAQELKNMLDLIDYENLEGIYKKVYDSILAEIFTVRLINQKSFSMHFSAQADIQFYAHTNTNFNRESDWNYGFEERSPLFLGSAEFWSKNYFYALHTLSLGIPSGIQNDKDYDNFYCINFTHNIPCLPPNSAMAFNLDVNPRSLLCFGGENWSFRVGRDKIKWGSGETGNLFLGGNSVYDDNFCFVMFFDKFKFTNLITFYPSEYDGITSSNSLNGIKSFIAHKFETRLFDQRLELSIAEAIMFQSVKNTFDVRIYNPMNFFHNYFIRNNANSILGVDANFAITQNLNVYAQIVMDDFTIFGETSPSNGKGGCPNAFGYMLGLKSVIPVENGFFNICVEGVYNDTYLYLRESYDSKNEIYGVSFYRYVREYDMINGSRINYYKVCTGYRYGGDCVVADLKLKYQGFHGNSYDMIWNIGCEFFYFAHGIVYTDNQWGVYPEGIYSPVSPSTVSPVGINPSSGAVQHTLRFSIFGDYEILKDFVVYATMDSYFIKNMRNKANKAWDFDFQFIFGIKYKI